MRQREQEMRDTNGEESNRSMNIDTCTYVSNIACCVSCNEHYVFVWNTIIPFCFSYSDWLIFFVLQNPHTPVYCISVFSPFCVCLVWPRGNCFTCDDSSLPRSSLSSSGNMKLNNYKLDYHASTCRCFVTFFWIMLALMNLPLGLGCEAPSWVFWYNFTNVCDVAKLVGLFCNHLELSLMPRSWELYKIALAIKLL